MGWSDGGIIGLNLAINAPERLTGVYALGANYQTAGLRPTVFKDTLIGAYVGYAAKQYAKLSSTPDNYEGFSGKVFGMWQNLPAYDDHQMKAISVPVKIAAGVYEEAVNKDILAFLSGL